MKQSVAQSVHPGTVTILCSDHLLPLWSNRLDISIETNNHALGTLIMPPTIYDVLPLILVHTVLGRNDCGHLLPLLQTRRGVPPVEFLNSGGWTTMNINFKKLIVS